MDSSPQENTTGHHSHQPKSSSDLFSSAKILAGEAQSAFSHGAVDKAAAAGAASDVLEGACKYGNLEQGKFGQYIEKAEGYLESYKSSGHSSAAAAGHGGGTTEDSSGGGGYGQSEGRTHSSSESGGGHGQSEGGSGGDYLKMAEGLVKKGGDGGDRGQSEGASGGDYLKMAQGFFKK